MGIYQSKRCSKRITLGLIFSLLLVDFIFLPNFAKAQIGEEVDNNIITEELLQQLKDEGIVGKEVTLDNIEDFNNITKEDTIEEIKPTDDLAEYNLTINKDGEIVSLQNKNSLTAIAFTYPGSSTFALPGDILITNSTVAMEYLDMLEL